MPLKTRLTAFLLGPRCQRELHTPQRTSATSLVGRNLPHPRDPRKANRPPQAHSRAWKRTQPPPPLPVPFSSLNAARARPRPGLRRTQGPHDGGSPGPSSQGGRPPLPPAPKAPPRTRWRRAAPGAGRGRLAWRQRPLAHRWPRPPPSGPRRHRPAEGPDPGGGRPSRHGPGFASRPGDAIALSGPRSSSRAPAAGPPEAERPPWRAGAGFGPKERLSERVLWQLRRRVLSGGGKVMKR